MHCRGWQNVGNSKISPDSPLGRKLMINFVSVFRRAETSGMALREGVGPGSGGVNGNNNWPENSKKTVFKDRLLASDLLSTNAHIHFVLFASRTLLLVQNG